MSTMLDVKTTVEIDKMRLEMDKIRAETRKLNRDYGLAPLAVGAALATACIGLAALILRTFAQ